MIRTTDTGGLSRQGALTMVWGINPDDRRYTFVMLCSRELGSPMWRCVVDDFGTLVSVGVVL